MSLPRPRVPLPHRILLIQKGALGDVVLTTALLDDLHRAFPGAVIDFAVGRAAAPLLEHHPLVHETVIVDAAPAWRLAPDIRARRYDWVVDVQSSARTALLTAWSGARVRIGWDARVRRAAYTHRLSRDRPPEYVVRERRRLLTLAGIATGDTPPHLELTAAERSEGERRLRDAGVPAGPPVVGLLLSTVEAPKNWPLDHFARLIPMLRAAGATPVVFHAPGEDERVARLRERAPTAIVLPEMGLRAFLGTLASCTVLVSGDTGPAHMADALGVARVTIFGPTSPAAWVPPGGRAIALASANPPILSMRARKRALGTREDYTADVTPEQVLDAVRGLIGTR